MVDESEDYGVGQSFFIFTSLNKVNNKKFTLKEMENVTNLMNQIMLSKNDDILDAYELKQFVLGKEFAEDIFGILKKHRNVNNIVLFVYKLIRFFFFF